MISSTMVKQGMLGHLGLLMVPARLNSGLFFLLVHLSVLLLPVRKYYAFVTMFEHCEFANIIQRKCLTGENFDKFDESKLPRQNFPYQYFTFQ